MVGINWGEPERVPQLQYSIRPYDRRVPKRLRKEHGKSHTVSSPLDRTIVAFPNVYAKNTESPTLLVVGTVTFSFQKFTVVTFIARGAM